MTDEKQRIYLDAQFALEELAERMKPATESKIGEEKFPVAHTRNKRLLEVVNGLSYYFRNKWEQQKAEDNAQYFKESAWKALNDVKKSLYKKETEK